MLITAFQIFISTKLFQAHFVQTINSIFYESFLLLLHNIDPKINIKDKMLSITVKEIAMFVASKNTFNLTHVPIVHNVVFPV